MTEFGEAIAALVADQGPKKDPCWYCEEEPKEGKKEFEIDAEPDTAESDDEDAIPENIDNDSSKLAKSMGDEPVWKIGNFHGNKESKIVPGAHHCIPGGAALNKVDAIIALIKKGVPYGVNHRHNGVWLPGNYAVRPGSEGWTTKWGDIRNKDFKDKYAERAMLAATTQFHDAHPKYNGKVRKCLEALANKLEAKEGKCPICGKDFDVDRPPYGLVGRLDAISSSHRALLTGVAKSNTTMKRSVQAGYFTSSRVKTFFDLVTDPAAETKADKAMAADLSGPKT
jgi:hypothetical protein